MSPELLAELEQAGALGGDQSGWERAELLLTQPPPAGSYVLHLVAAGVAAGCERLRFTCTVPEVCLEGQGGWTWPAAALARLGPELLRLPLRRSLAQLALGCLRALSAGASSVELLSGSHRVLLTPSGVVLGTCPARTGFGLRVAWPARGAVPEPELLEQRCRLSPVPIEVNGESVSVGLQLGECAVAREGAGALALPVAAQPLVFHRVPGQGAWTWLGLGGAWFLDQGPGARVWFVVDGLSYALDHIELGCSDLRAVVHAGKVRTDASLTCLERDGVVAGLLAQLRQQVEAAKLELAAAFPVPGERGAGLWSVLRQAVCEQRARGPAHSALDLCRRILSVDSEQRTRDFFLEAAAGLASRLEDHPLALSFMEQALEAPEQSVGHALRLESQGVVCLEAGLPQRAEVALLQAEALKKQLLDAQEPHWVAETLERLAQVCLAQGRYSQAERYAKRAVARVLEGLGERHPVAAQALLGMVRVYLAQDRLEEARRVVSQVLSGPSRGPWEEAQALLHQGLVAYLEGRWEEAQASAAEASQRLTQSSGEGAIEVLGAWLLEGLAWGGQERWGEAARRLADCLRGLESNFGTEHTDVAAARLALARIRWREGKLDLARLHLDRAATVYRERWGEHHPALGRTLDLSARVYLAAGEPGSAEREARQAVAILDRTLSGPDPGESHRDSAGTVIYRWWRPLDEQGLRSPIGLPPWRLGREPEELARAQAHLAKVLRMLERPQEAEVWAARARQIRQTVGRATLRQEAGGLVRLSPDAIAVKLELRAPGRRLQWLRLDTARGRVALAAGEDEGAAQDLMLALKEPERKLLQRDSPLFLEPWKDQPVQFLLYAADQGSSRVSAIPYVVTVGFAEGPCLRLPVRLP